MGKIHSESDYDFNSGPIAIKLKQGTNCDIKSNKFYFLKKSSHSEKVSG